jgi:hypothetical protein
MGSNTGNVSISKSLGMVNKDGSHGALLRGYTLVIARVAWSTLILLVVGLYFWAIRSWNLSQQDIPYLIIIPLAYISIGLVIFWRRSDELMGMLTSIMLIFFSPYLTSGVNVWISEKSGWETFGGVMVGIAGGTVIFFIFLFPNGRFVPAWLRWFTISASLLGLMVLSSLVRIWPNLPAIVFLPIAAVGLLSQVYCYWRVSNPIQRQQTKWVLIGLTVNLIGLLLWVMLGSLTATGLPELRLIGIPIPITYLYSLVALVFPMTIAFSILRYRLWDIDVIIRRTLFYGALSMLLVAVYFSSVVLLQQAFRALTGQDSPVAFVISTLVIAALFNPLRARVQEAIDRRFYRRKYDAQQALAAFATASRDEVDLECLQMELVSIVKETMQPEQISLWLQTVKPLPYIRSRFEDKS